MEFIRFADGYKYQLRETYSTQLAIRPSKTIVTQWMMLDASGLLTVLAGYAWDGPSGPTVDTADSMRASLVHDALYQLMREKHLDHAAYRKQADQELLRICLEDGMLGLRARAWYFFVRWFADPASDPAKLAPDKCAPCDCGQVVAK